MKQAVFWMIGVVFLSQIQGQDRKVFYPSQVAWTKLEANEIFDNKVGIGLDYVHRTKNILGEGTMFDTHARSSIRPWIHYQFGTNARASISPIGYFTSNDHIATEADMGRPSYHELRTTFQYFHHHKQLNGRLMHTWRYRYELRWQEQPLLESYRFFSRFRFRYRIRYVINQEDFYENNALYGMISNEIGLNMGRNVVMNTFNQNRLYVGVGYRFFNSARVELRYVDRVRTRGATGFEMDLEKGLMLGLYIDQISSLGRRKIEGVRFAD